MAKWSMRLFRLIMFNDAHRCDDLQKQRIAVLNRDIDLGLEQLARGDVVDANHSYSKMKAKIARRTKEEE